MKQMKVALPDDLRARLDAASKKSGRSVAEEIRARVKPKGSTAFGDRPHATVINDDPNQLGLLIEVLLYKSPDYSNSPQRQAMEEAHQKMKADLSKSGTKIRTRVTPKHELPTFEELTKGKKS